MALNFSVQSLQFRRRNKQGKMTLRYVWDVVSREDAPARMLIEAWGGKPDGYIKTFGTDLMLGKYLSGRVAKGAAISADDDIDLQMVGDADYLVTGPLNRLGKALKAKNHENAKIRLGISGANQKWDEEACLNKIVAGIVDFGEDGITCDQLNQAMASRVKLTFKLGGNYAESILAIDEFMTSGIDISDVLDSEKIVYLAMDGERIAEIIRLADGLRDGLRDKMEVEASKMPTPEIHIPEPVIERGSDWGGWA